MRSLIERNGGVATIAPSMREIPLAHNSQVFNFARELFADGIDIMIFMTGVGARGLLEVLETQVPPPRFFEALQKCTVIVRGPKPATVLREWKVRITHQVPEPNTSQELLTLLDARVPLAGKVTAVQEYGQPNDELYQELQARGARVLRVPVYRWGLPEDTGPLREAIQQTIRGKLDVLMFTSANQLTHVLTVADSLGVRDKWLAAAAKCVIASIGPTATETLEAAGLKPDLEPEHPKMGHLVRAAALAAGPILAVKRAPAKRPAAAKRPTAKPASAAKQAAAAPRARRRPR
jgi:uroporphyrinogen-III synthase